MKTEWFGFWCALLAWVVLFVAIRALALDADPPRVLPNGARSQELWAEGAAKAQEARNWALFGRWQVNPADNYQFWRPQAPVWVYSLAGFLKLFGVSTLAHRAHSILVAALGFVLVMVHARRQLRSIAWGTLGLFLAGNYYYILYTRVGLIEPMVNLFSALMVLSCHRALTRPLWLVPATWALVLALFSKMSGLYLLPVLLTCALVALVRHRELGVRFWVPVALHGLLVVVLLALYTTSPTYQQRVVWTIAHMSYNKDGETEVDFGRIDLWDVPRRLIDWRRWRDSFFTLFPVSVPLGLVSFGNTLAKLWRERRLDWDGLNLLWLLAALAPLQLTESTYVRFYLTLFPPMALLGARGLDLLLGWLGCWAPARLGLAGLVVALFLGVHGSHYSSWWEHRTYQVRNVNRKLQRLVPDRRHAVFVGMWAPWLMFDTRHEFHTVRSYFNVTREAQAELGVTHLLLRRNDLSGSKVKKNFPREFRRKKRLGRFRVHGDVISLYALRRPLRR